MHKHFLLASFFPLSSDQPHPVALRANWGWNQNPSSSLWMRRKAIGIRSWEGRGSLYRYQMALFKKTFLPPRPITSRPHIIALSLYVRWRGAGRKLNKTEHFFQSHLIASDYSLFESIFLCIYMPSIHNPQRFYFTSMFARRFGWGK